MSNESTFKYRILEEGKWGDRLLGAGLGALGLGAIGVGTDWGHDALDNMRELHQQGQLWNTGVNKVSSWLEHLKTHPNVETNNGSTIDLTKLNTKPQADLYKLTIGMPTNSPLISIEGNGGGSWGGESSKTDKLEELVKTNASSPAPGQGPTETSSPLTGNNTAEKLHNINKGDEAIDKGVASGAFTSIHSPKEVEAGSGHGWYSLWKKAGLNNEDRKNYDPTTNFQSRYGEH